MSPLLTWLGANPGLTNLIAAVLNLVIAGVIYWSKPKMFQRHPFTRRVFYMWVGQWFAFLVIFIVFNIISRVAPTSEGQQWWLVLLLCSVEIQTIFALACGWLMLGGNQYDVKRVLGVAGILLLCLWLWDISLGLIFGASPSLRELWIFPSRIFAMFAFLLLSVALFFRNKLTTVPFLVITIGYATAQLPVYDGTFVSRVSVNNWFTALAIGKLFIALTFYPAFFSAKSFARITLRDLVGNKPAFVHSLVQSKPWLVHAIFWTITVAAEEILRNSLARVFGYK